MKTPTTAQGLRRYDNLPAGEAVRRAWFSPGVRNEWHRHAQDAVRNIMPLLARALDRLDRKNVCSECGTQLGE